MAKNLTPLLVVAAALPDGNGRWLMHRRPAHKQHGGLWEFPGGKLEPGETARAALARELEEETGLRVSARSFIEIGFATGPHSDTPGGIVILLYTASVWVGIPEAREGGELRWFRHGEIASLAMPPLDVELARQLRRFSP